MLRSTIAVFALLLAGSAAAQAPVPATDITAAEVQAFVKQLPPMAISDRPIRVVDVGGYKIGVDRKSTRLNSSHIQKSRMPSSA